MPSRARWTVALFAALLNVLGSPMAWAHFTSAPAAQATETCHGHAPEAAESESAPAPDAMLCCDGAGCSCAAPALSVFVTPEPMSVANPELSASGDTLAIPAHPLDDALRPPIR